MSNDETPISDHLKQVVDDLQLEAKVREATAAAEQAVLRGLEATGSYLRDHREDIEGFVDWAGAAIDRQTSGRYADRVDQIRGQLVAGVAILADREWHATGPSGSTHELGGPEEPGWSGSTDEV